MKTILLSVLFTLATMFAAGSAQAARPAITDPACNGAVPADTLIRIEVKKTDLNACPEGLRSPYLCAMHKAGFSSRSLGYAMRHTIVSLSDGTCERVNMGGALIYDAHGKTVSGEKFANPSRKLPETGLRFGAWKTSVLYLTPEGAGDAQLASCTADLASSRAALATKSAAKEVVTTCPTCPKATCPKATCPETKCPACPKCAKTKMDKTAKASECPAAECPECAPSPTAEELHAQVEAFNARTAERDGLIKDLGAIKAQVNSLLPVATKIAECRNAGYLYDSAKNTCVTQPELDARIALKAQERLASAAAELDRLRAAFRSIKQCTAGGGKYRFTSDTDGWCDTSR